MIEAHLGDPEKKNKHLDDESCDFELDMFVWVWVLV